jgi:hypothetical protein
MRKLTKEQKRDIRAIAAKRDEDIDFSDAHAVVDWGGAEIGKFYRKMRLYGRSSILIRAKFIRLLAGKSLCWPSLESLNGHRPFSWR